MTEQPITFKAQIAPIQSGFMVGPDTALIKLLLLEMNEALAGKLYDLQEKAFKLKAIDVMGDITVNASIPDTQSGICVNKKTPYIKILIPKVDTLESFRFYALYGRAFEVQITKGDGKEKAKQTAAKKAEPKEKQAKGPHSDFWREMFRGRHFYYDRDLWYVLNLENGDSVQVRVSLHDEFKVESLSVVSPQAFIEWAKANHLQRLADVAEEVALTSAQEVKE